MAIHSSGQTVFSLSHIEGNTLGGGEKVDRGLGGMRVDRIGDVGDRTSEEDIVERHD